MQTDKPNRRGAARSEETRRAIVLAAIRLIAERGLDGASLRSINLAAGCRNSSAAHYHFGDRDHVIEAAIALMHHESAADRGARLDALEDRMRRGQAIAAREVLEALYLPYLALIARPEFGLKAAKFVSRVLVEADANIQAIVNRSVQPEALRALPLLAHALPGVPLEVLALRLFATATNVIHGAGDLAALGDSPMGNLGAAPPALLLHRLFEYLTAAVSAPATDPPAAMRLP